MAINGTEMTEPGERAQRDVLLQCMYKAFVVEEEGTTHETVIPEFRGEGGEVGKWKQEDQKFKFILD